MLEEGGFEDEAMRGAMTAMELGLANLAEQIQRKAGEPAPADFLEKLRKIMSDHMTSTLRAKMGSIKQQAATIYAQEFTFLELRRIRELSTDPVMVKARERNKIIGPKLMALGAYSMRDAQPELEAKIQDLVADYLADQGRNPDQS